MFPTMPCTAGRDEGPEAFELNELEERKRAITASAKKRKLH